MGELRFGSQPPRVRSSTSRSARRARRVLRVNLGRRPARRPPCETEPANVAATRTPRAALAAGYTETQGDDEGQYMLRRLIPRDTVMCWPGLGIDELASELDVLLPIYEAMAAPPSPPPGSKTQPNEDEVDPLFVELEEALDDRGQAILYGPPGTGKTWNAHRFALWWLTKRWGGELPRARGSGAHVAADAATHARSTRAAGVVGRRQSRGVEWDQPVPDGAVDYRYGRVQAGTTSSCRRAISSSATRRTPTSGSMALARIARRCTRRPMGRRSRSSRCKGSRRHDVRRTDADPVLAVSEPTRLRNQGTLFRLSGRGRHHPRYARGTEPEPARPSRRTTPSEGIGPLDAGDLPPELRVRGLRRGLPARADARPASSIWR